MEIYLPYIVSVLVALISGIVTYSVAIKNVKGSLESVKEANRHDIDKLMEQHKIDIDSLERKHEMELEKINLEHQLQMERSQKEFEHQFGGNMMNTMISEAMKMPEIRQQITSGMKSGNKSRK